jgi:hypothetical protein
LANSSPPIGLKFVKGLQDPDGRRLQQGSECLSSAGRSNNPNMEN